MSLDEEASKRFVNQLISVFIEPEIQRRLKMDMLPKNFLLARAQVILRPDGHILVRLNEEVKAVAEVILKPGVTKKAGEPILENEIAEIRDVRLPQEENGDSGHATLYFRGSQVTVYFDFRRNRSKARERVEAAKEFYDAATVIRKQQLWRPFVDNLYSCVELLANAQLFVISEPRYVRKPSHKSTHLRYNSFASLGNFKPEYRGALNKLSGLRDGARYLSRPFKITPAEADSFLVTVADMIRYTEQVII